VGRLMTLDTSTSGVLVVCSCGNRSIVASRDAAGVMADEHRRAAHPRKATYVESKRRARRRSVGLRLDAGDALAPRRSRAGVPPERGEAPSRSGKGPL